MDYTKKDEKEVQDAVQCPYCYAPKGDRCFVKGYRPHPHPSRVKLANEMRATSRVEARAEAHD